MHLLQRELAGSTSPSTPAARRHAAAAALVAMAALVLAAVPARADYDEDEIFCDVHHGYYAPDHFRSHLDGYVVLSTGGYHFYPRPVYGTLAADFYGRPAVYLSGGYFYPLWVGYGPVYEPTGYFEIYGGHFGRTQLGLRIGINALPTVGFGFLGYPSTVVHYAPHPRYYYFRGATRPPHVYYRGGPPYRHPPRRRF